MDTAEEVQPLCARSPCPQDICEPSLRSGSSQDYSDQSEQGDVVFSSDPKFQSIPRWTRGLSGCKYFGPCSEHRHLKRNECTYYCVTCESSEALCHQCLADHDGHHIIQVRRYVYEDVVNATDVKELINMEGVQTYTINQAAVIFVKDRPPIGTARNNHKNACVMCSRCLKPDFKFCSIACKVNAAEAWNQPEIVEPLVSSSADVNIHQQQHRVLPVARRGPRGARCNIRRSSSLEAECISVKFPVARNPDNLLVAAAAAKAPCRAADNAEDLLLDNCFPKRKLDTVNHPSRRKQLFPQRSPSL